MTVYPLERVQSWKGNVARPVAAAVDDAVLLRRCALWRDAFKGTAVSYAAPLLGHAPAVSWMRRHRVTVDVGTVGEFDQAAAAGIAPAQLVMWAGDNAAIRRAIDGGAARFVVSTGAQLETLAGSDRIHRVVVDARRVRALATDALACRDIDVIGLHCALDDPDDPIGANALRTAVAEMARFRREHSVLFTRISLSGLDVGPLSLEPRVLRRVAAAITEVVGEECARYRYPRPALTVAPRPSVLLPAL